MYDKELPEEKLLKVIRKGTDKSVEFNKDKRINRFVVLLHKLSFLFNAKVLLRLLLLSLFIVAIFLTKEFLISLDSSEYVQQATLDDVLDSDEIFVSEQRVGLDEYLAEIEKKDIFNVGPSKVVEASNDTVALQDISLLGVITEEPVQAIIKDKKNDNTFFLKVGDRFGLFLIKSIAEGVVEIELNGKLFELRM